MSEQYIDPNSGAASQPGGASIEAPNPIEAVVGQDGAVETIPAEELERKQLEQADKEAELDQTGVQTYFASGDLVVNADGADSVITKSIEGAGSSNEAEEAEEEADESDKSDGTDSASTETVTDPTEVTKAVDTPAYDPSAHTGDQVLEHILEHPEEQETILAAERAGKNRKTIINAF